MTVPDSLSAAVGTYQLTFGHHVPTEVVEMFAHRPGPLMMEIRQAVALKKPVPAWLARSRLPATATTAGPSADWPFAAPRERRF